MKGSATILSVTNKSSLSVPPGTRRVSVRKRHGAVESDLVAVETPLEIQVNQRPLVITMRTPGHDEELATGFLFGEGIVSGAHQITSIHTQDQQTALTTGELATGRIGRGDRVLVELEDAPPAASVDRAQREFRATAACGVCGKGRLEDLDQPLPPIRQVECPTEILDVLPNRMRPHQALFAVTGGIHAAGLFTLSGELLWVREDIGRHNAVDKVIGRAVLQGATSLEDRILVVSGRAGFELVQKALKAAIPIMVSVGAASSLAIDMAAAAGMTLYSFVGDRRGNLHI